MNAALPRPNQTAPAPQGYRDALAELVQVGLSVARMVGRLAEAETAAAEAATRLSHPADEAVASTLAEAIERDQAFAAASEARQVAVARADTVARAFARVARSVRLTVAMAERVDRGWARRSAADDRQAMARRQVVRGVAEAIERRVGRGAPGEDGVRETERERLTEAFEERLERLDEESALGDGPAEEIIAAICRDLGLDAASMTVQPPLPEMARFVAEDGVAPPEGARWRWQMGPPRYPPLI